MSTDAEFETNLIEYLSTFASVRSKPRRLCAVLATSFSKRYGQKKAFGSFRDRALQIFSKLHEIDLDILNKVEILYIFIVTVSDEMKQVLDQFPSFRYTLDGRGKLVAFSTGDGVMTIEEGNGKRKGDVEEVADGVQTPERRRTGSEEATGGVAAEVGVEEEAEGVEMDVKPVIRQNPERAQAVKPEHRNPVPKIEQATAEVCALQLVKGVAGMAHIFHSTKWYNEATEKLKSLSGKDKTVAMDELCAALTFVVTKINASMKTDFQIGSVGVKEFLIALQSSVVFPFGVELMSKELEKIDGEMRKIDKMEAKAREKGEAVEQRFIPKDAVEACIRYLLSLTAYC